MRIRTAATAALALATALTLAGCAGNSGSSSESMPGMDHGSSSSPSVVMADFNDADVMFAQMMIPHHQQAVEMSEILLAKDDIPAEVIEFAQGVIDAQGPEIDRMNTMLETWEEDPVTGDMGEMDHGGMSGMMSEEDMTALEDAQGTEAARLYLEQMTAHHEGAVDMARDEVTDGQNPQAIALAEQVIEDQEAEIAEMEQMLNEL